MGGVSGAGKIFVNIGNSIASGIDKFTRASLPVANAAALLGNAIALGSKFITSGIRFILKSITQRLKL